MLPLTSRIDPDIQVKYHQIVAHMNEKNKVIEQFVRILREFCDWEMFNSRNLDKFANSISKLLVGKDPLKDTFILFERILASKSQQSNKIAVSIKEDMLPFLQNAYNLKQQNSIKLRQGQIKQLKAVMHQKVRQLCSAQVNYKTAAQRLKSANSRPFSHSRQQLQQLTLLKRSLIDAQAYLTQVINIYNMAIQDYMLQYSSLCEQLSSIQTNRKTVIKQSISKYIVFEMDAIKNIQYDLSRYAKTIQKMDDKLIIQQKVTQDYDILRVQLAKISLNNYLGHLTQNNDKNLQQTESQKKLNQIKKFLDPLKENCQIYKQSYTSLINDINQLLTQAQQVFDVKTVKEIVYYSSNYFMCSSVPNIINDETQRLTFRRVRIPLINGVVCHPIFYNQPFWERYSNRLNDMVQKQVGTINNYRRQDDQRISTSLLAGDIDFMKKLSVVPIVEKIRLRYTKYTTVSSEHLLKSTDSIKARTQTNDSKTVIKDKNSSTQLQDILYF